MFADRFPCFHCLFPSPLWPWTQRTLFRFLFTPSRSRTLWTPTRKLTSFFLPHFKRRCLLFIVPSSSMLPLFCSTFSDPLFAPSQLHHCKPTGFFFMPHVQTVFRVPFISRLFLEIEDALFRSTYFCMSEKGFSTFLVCSPLSSALFLYISPPKDER